MFCGSWRQSKVWPDIWIGKILTFLSLGKSTGGLKRNYDKDPDYGNEKRAKVRNDKPYGTDVGMYKR
jgi:hypothetical protein